MLVNIYTPGKNTASYDAESCEIKLTRYFHGNSIYNVFIWSSFSYSAFCALFLSNYADSLPWTKPLCLINKEGKFIHLSMEKTALASKQSVYGNETLQTKHIISENLHCKSRQNTFPLLHASLYISRARKGNLIILRPKLAWNPFQVRPICKCTSHFVVIISTNGVANAAHDVATFKPHTKASHIIKELIHIQL